MVAPSAWASHILVNSKSEAIQIKDKVSKLKDFQKMDYLHHGSFELECILVALS
mgnify:CR=1 FL=1